METYAGLLPTWLELFPLTHPSPRYFSQMTYDGKMGGVVLFGGVENYLPPFYDHNDTWLFRGGTWTNLTQGQAPPARHWGGLAFDVGLGCDVLFGGDNETSNFYDTWLYCNGIWTKVAPTDSPSRRSGFGLTYDPNCLCIVLYGGVATIKGAQVVYNDTWEFDGRDWVNVTPPMSPPALTSIGLEYDEIDNSLVMQGGATPTGDINQTWLFSSGVWTRVANSGAPPPQESYTIARDGMTGGVLFFGGWFGAPFSLSNATYLFSKGRWSVEPVVGTNPGIRRGAVWSYDPDCNCALYFGGEFPVRNTSYMHDYQDTWEFGAVNVSLRATGAFPPRTTWNVTVNGSSRFGVNSTVVFQAGRGTYNISVPAFPLSVGARVGPNQTDLLIDVVNGPLSIDVFYFTQFLLTVVTAPEHEGNVTPSSGWFDEGVSLVLSVEPAKGWILGSWWGYGVGSYSGDAMSAQVTLLSPISESADMVQTFPVNFTLSTFIPGIHWVMDVAGTLSSSGAPSTVVQEPDGTYDWSAPPIALSQWNRLVLTPYEGNFSVRGAGVNITLLVSSAFWVAINVLPANGGTVSPSSGWVLAGTSMVLHAIASRGYLFSAWTSPDPSGSNTGADPLQIVANGPLNETARFTSDGVGTGFLGGYWWDELFIGLGGGAVVLAVVSRIGSIRRRRASSPGDGPGTIRA